MTTKTLKTKRSMTGNHPLLPASQPSTGHSFLPQLPTYTLITWTFGRGSVIWRIWPAVLLHTLFAAAVVSLSMQHIYDLEIPNVMLTVLGVVIGFVISYRAMSGYDRYLAGRTSWSDVMKNSRTLTRLIWFHVPPRLTPKTPEETTSGEVNRPVEELNKVMAEKRIALDLVEGFAVALKHHLRGECGIYYEDLYPLVRPMHDHFHTADDKHTQHVLTTALPEPRKAQRITTNTTKLHPPVSESSSSHEAEVSVTNHDEMNAPDPVIPSINDYGTFDPNKLSSHHASTSRHRSRRASSGSSASSASSQSQRRPLLPSSKPRETGTKISKDLIPFAWMFVSLGRKLKRTPKNNEDINGHNGTLSRIRPGWQTPVDESLYVKHRPKVAGNGNNLPLEILRCVSEWFSVLEDRATVPGTSMGTMVATLAAFEDSLSTLERILTTPLPFAYAVHIRHTVWLYLFFLPFQLVSQFGYYTIPGVAIAAFIYLGFIAAGEEMEQPFGYDANDLDLDLFCQAIIHQDILHLKSSPCLNAYFGPKLKHHSVMPRRSRTLSEITGDNGHLEEDED
ncbi:Bestrophin, RFP-TM, chloride channel-domain-containing protein [Crepidotus variabilis]|uniref:Bestrophin, RFP-TM, chloride channel-domain-containing protein n=1 Tax=Crepidotus variabilis TaxID=179855 RepID=A0A9P6JKY7_9AGAR|nr:Bestrophin, RFP-TM, chloride channel-domain-containing protein [Crepidotus variabilis]